MIFKLCKWLWNIIRKVFCFVITGHKWKWLKNQDDKSHYICMVCKKFGGVFEDTPGHIITKLKDN